MEPGLSSDTAFRFRIGNRPAGWRPAIATAGSAGQSHSLRFPRAAMYKRLNFDAFARMVKRALIHCGDSRLPFISLTIGSP